MINAITGLPNRVSHLREDVIIDGSLRIIGSTILNNGTYLSYEASTYSLGEAASYVILTPNALTVTTAAQLVSGDVGSSALTGTMIFMNGAYYTGAMITQPVADALALYQDLSALTATYTFGAGAVVLDTVDVGNGTGIFKPGIFKTQSVAAASIGSSGIVTLDGAGDYVFVIDGAMTTGANSIIKLINGATPNRVFWVSLAAMTTGADSIFKGTSLSPAGQSTGANSNIQGRLISVSAAIVIGAVNSLNVAN